MPVYGRCTINNSFTFTRSRSVLNLQLNTLIYFISWLLSSTVIIFNQISLLCCSSRILQSFLRIFVRQFKAWFEIIWPIYAKMWLIDFNRYISHFISYQWGTSVVDCHREFILSSLWEHNAVISYGKSLNRLKPNQHDISPIPTENHFRR